MNHLPRTTLFILLFPFTALGQAADIEQRLLSTQGYGEVKIEADQAQVQMQVLTTHKSAKDAKATVDQRVNNVLDALSALKIGEKDIVASNLRINPNFDYINREQVFTGYTASRDIRVTLKKLDQLDSLLSAVIDAGVNQVNGISLENSQAEKYQRMAHEQAIADSKAKAQSLAKAYGAELGPVHQISYHNNQVNFAPAPEGVMAKMAMDTSGGRYLHDDITYSDNIQVTFELIIPH